MLLILLLAFCGSLSCPHRKRSALDCVLTVKYTVEVVPQQDARFNPVSLGSEPLDGFGEEKQTRMYKRYVDMNFNEFSSRMNT